MSSLLAGSMTRHRFATPATEREVHRPAAATEGARGERASVSHWQDALATLVPAEVLAVHALAMSLGTTTTGTGATAATVITNPTEMAWVFYGLTVAAFVLYLAGIRAFDRVTVLTQVVGALTAAAAFVLWTMIHPTSAFHAVVLPFELSPFLTVMVGVGGALVLGLVTKVLAVVADRHDPAPSAAPEAGQAAMLEDGASAGFAAA